MYSFPPIGGFPPIFHGFFTLMRSVQIWRESRLICRGGIHFISTQHCPKMAKNSHFQPRKFTTRIHPDRRVVWKRKTNRLALSLTCTFSSTLPAAAGYRNATLTNKVESLHPASAEGVIVLTPCVRMCVCLSVCLSVSLS